MKFSKVLIIVFVFLVIPSITVSQVPYLSIKSLSKHSLDIIEGDVIKIAQTWDKNKRFIKTHITIKIVKSYKSAIKSDTVELEHFGGSIGDIATVTNIDHPKFSIGEKVLVFICKENDCYLTFGSAQGKFIIHGNGADRILKRTMDTKKYFRIGNSEENMKNEYTYREVTDIISEFTNNKEKMS